MKKRSMMILLIITIVETLIISIYIIGKTFNKDDFIFKQNEEQPFPHSFSFVFNKSNDTHGFITIGKDGKFTSIFLNDNAGRLITVGFDDEHIVSYVILDNENNYEMQTFFIKHSLNNENKIVLSRKEGFNDNKQNYFIDYNDSPFFFNSKNYIKFEEFEIDAIK